MAERKILSVEELNGLSNHLNRLVGYIDQTTTDMRTVINSFNNESIVNSFYASGNYGSDVETKLTGILSALEKYTNVISSGEDSLIAQTQKYIERQIELVENGK